MKTLAYLVLTIFLMTILFNCFLPYENMWVVLDSFENINGNQIFVNYTVYSDNYANVYTTIEIYIEDINKKVYTTHNSFNFPVNKRKMTFSSIIETKETPNISTLKINLEGATYYIN